MGNPSGNESRTRRLLALLLAVAPLAGATTAVAQVPPPGYGPPPPGYGPTPPGYGPAPYGAPPPGYGPAMPGYPPPMTPTRSPGEIGTLYATSVAYGVGLGAWFGIEAEIRDPGVFLIAPAVLGAAAPVGVFLLDRPELPEGLPGAIASGFVIGAGEGLGIAGVHDTTVRESWRWGIRGFARSTALGATLGGVGGGLVGYYLEPAPESSFLTTSGIVWGTAIGSFFGYGASPTGEGWSGSNDWAAVGGLIGYNVALGATSALGALWIPTWEQLGYMWAGAGIGAVVSLPVFLLYAGEGGPPAKRGLLFTGTATTLGLAVAAIAVPGDDSFGVARHRAPGLIGKWGAVTTLAPMTYGGGLGVMVGGVLF